MNRLATRDLVFHVDMFDGVHEGDVAFVVDVGDFPVLDRLGDDAGGFGRAFDSGTNPNLLQDRGPQLFALGELVAKVKDIAVGLFRKREIRRGDRE